MSWKQKSEHLDKRTGMHHVVLHEPGSGAEHHVVMLAGHESCNGCGHVHLRTVDGEFDPRARVAAELNALQDSHDAMEVYAKKHGVAVLEANGKVRAAR